MPWLLLCIFILQVAIATILYFYSAGCYSNYDVLILQVAMVTILVFYSAGYYGDYFFSAGCYGNYFVFLFHRLLRLQWKQNVDEAMSMINKAIDMDNKCEYAYEVLGTLEVQRSVK